MAPFLQAAAGTALGLAVFTGLLILLTGISFTQQLDDSEAYAAAFSETGAYDRIYDEVLADEALKAQTGGLLGNIEMESHAEVMELLREVMPPDYLREQVEANVERLTSYLRYERDALEVYVDLKEPLERVKPAALGRVHRLVDDLEIIEPEAPGCSLEALQRLAAASADLYARMSQGRLPDSVPSLETLSRECREREFDRWFGYVLDDPVVNARAARILGNQVEELRQTFVDGDTRGLLKAAAEPLVEPVIDSAVADVRRQLSPEGRIDLLEWLADRPGGPGRAGMERQAGSLRETLRTANGPGRTIAVVAVVLGGLLMALVHLPRPAAMLSWPGVTLLAGGAVCLIVGFAVHSALPGLAGSAVASYLTSSAEVPAPAVSLATDLAESFVRQATGGFLPMTMAVMTLGAVLVVASLYCNRLSAWLGRFTPSPGDGPRTS